ncbi:phytanoyl-CoA dioxygenase family protein [Chaetomium strumarium]|uniref:Phytanoyl-CoA dioxygenase family protein n=1 Tax=Chaetomium strumarium TaxID=1170767 RepID=A0AAJ0M3B7_9PEZI|nr:phytanoyl-CoA dioxygenase family protein [Chaetomium strumarium]
MSAHLDDAKAHLNEHGWCRIPNVRVFYLLELDPIFRDLIANPTANRDEPAWSSWNPGRTSGRVNVIWCLTDVEPGQRRDAVHPRVPTGTSAAPTLPAHNARAAGAVRGQRPATSSSWTAASGTRAGGANVTADQDRALLFGYYTRRPSMRQPVNWTAKLPREIQDILSPELKERLGQGPVGNVGLAGDLGYLSMLYPGGCRRCRREVTGSGHISQWKLREQAAW